MRKYCTFCGTKLTDGYDEERTKDGQRVCNECIESMTDDEMEMILEDAA